MYLGPVDGRFGLWQNKWSRFSICFLAVCWWTTFLYLRSLWPCWASAWPSCSAQRSVGPAVACERSKLRGRLGGVLSTMADHPLFTSSPSPEVCPRTVMTCFLATARTSLHSTPTGLSASLHLPTVSWTLNQMISLLHTQNILCPCILYTPSQQQWSSLTTHPSPKGNCNKPMVLYHNTLCFQVAILLWVWVFYEGKSVDTPRLTHRRFYVKHSLSFNESWSVLVYVSSQFQWAVTFSKHLIFKKHFTKAMVPPCGHLYSRLLLKIQDVTKLLYGVSCNLFIDDSSIIILCTVVIRYF